MVQKQGEGEAMEDDSSSTSGESDDESNEELSCIGDRDSWHLGVSRVRAVQFGRLEPLPLPSRVRVVGASPVTAAVVSALERRLQREGHHGVRMMPLGPWGLHAVQVEVQCSQCAEQGCDHAAGATAAARSWGFVNEAAQPVDGQYHVVAVRDPLLAVPADCADLTSLRANELKEARRVGGARVCSHQGRRCQGSCRGHAVCLALPEDDALPDPFAVKHVAQMLAGACWSHGRLGCRGRGCVRAGVRMDARLRTGAALGFASKEDAALFRERYDAVLGPHRLAVGHGASRPQEMHVSALGIYRLLRGLGGFTALHRSAFVSVVAIAPPHLQQSALAAEKDLKALEALRNALQAVARAERGFVDERRDQAVDSLAPLLFELGAELVAQAPADQRERLAGRLLEHRASVRAEASNCGRLFAQMAKRHAQRRGADLYDPGIDGQDRGALGTPFGVCAGLLRALGERSFAVSLRAVAGNGTGIFIPGIEGPCVAIGRNAARLLTKQVDVLDEHGEVSSEVLDALVRGAHRCPDGQRPGANWIWTRKLGLVHLDADGPPPGARWSRGGELPLWHGEPANMKEEELRRARCAWRAWCYEHDAEILGRHLKTGDRACLKRSPVYVGQSFNYVHVLVLPYDSWVVKIDAFLVDPQDADFDGDCVELYVPADCLAEEALRCFDALEQLLFPRGAAATGLRVTSLEGGVKLFSLISPEGRARARLNRPEVLEMVRTLPFADRLYEAVVEEPGRYPFSSRRRLRREFTPWSLVTLAMLGSLPEGVEPPTVLDGEGRLLMHKGCWVPASCKLLAWPSRAGLRLDRWERLAAHLLLGHYEPCGSAAEDARREATRRRAASSAPPARRRLPCAVIVELLGGDALRVRRALEGTPPASVVVLWRLGFGSVPEARAAAERMRGLCATDSCTAEVELREEDVPRARSALEPLRPSSWTTCWRLEYSTPCEARAAHSILVWLRLEGSARLAPPSPLRRQDAPRLRIDALALWTSRVERPRRLRAVLARRVQPPRRLRLRDELAPSLTAAEASVLRILVVVPVAPTEGRDWQERVERGGDKAVIELLQLGKEVAEASLSFRESPARARPGRRAWVWDLDAKCLEPESRALRGAWLAELSGVLPAGVELRRLMPRTSFWGLTGWNPERVSRAGGQLFLLFFRHFGRRVAQYLGGGSALRAASASLPAALPRSACRQASLPPLLRRSCAVLAASTEPPSSAEEQAIVGERGLQALLDLEDGRSARLLAETPSILEQADAVFVGRLVERPACAQALRLQLTLPLMELRRPGGRELPEEPEKVRMLRRALSWYVAKRKGLRRAGTKTNEPPGQLPSLDFSASSPSSAVHRLILAAPSPSGPCAIASCFLHGLMRVCEEVNRFMPSPFPSLIPQDWGLRLLACWREQVVRKTEFVVERAVAGGAVAAASAAALGREVERHVKVLNFVTEAIGVRRAGQQACLEALAAYAVDSPELPLKLADVEASCQVLVPLYLRGFRDGQRLHAYVSKADVARKRGLEADLFLALPPTALAQQLACGKLTPECLRSQLGRTTAPGAPAPRGAISERPWDVRRRFVAAELPLFTHLSHTDELLQKNHAGWGIGPKVTLGLVGYARELRTKRDATISQDGVGNMIWEQIDPAEICPTCSERRVAGLDRCPHCDDVYAWRRPDGVCRVCGAGAVASHEPQCSRCLSLADGEGQKALLVPRDARRAETYRRRHALRMEPQRLQVVRRRLDGETAYWLEGCGKRRRVDGRVVPELHVRAALLRVRRVYSAEGACSTESGEEAEPRTLEAWRRADGENVGPAGPVVLEREASI